MLIDGGGGQKETFMWKIIGCVLVFGLVAVVLVWVEQLKTQLNVEVVEVQLHCLAGSIIVGDVLGGTLIGAAAGGGVVLYNHYVTNSGNGDWGNWQHTVLIGAGIGL